ncbi:death-inducer obliterator 1-like [Patiria miniata]|uniref:PHD-type domain-containing protein n=1 Tax=Patiria miniata TaxID=46514 RepID=A0A914ARM0_PATMI|nr:death-inducer obliterator 1-like [Patiria miniata]
MSYSEGTTSPQDEIARSFQYLLSMMKAGEEKDKDKDKEIIDDEADKPRHCCICSSIDRTRLMIRCDYCEQWYHGDCIGLEKETTEWIKRYACPPCSEANPEAKTVYKEERGKDLAEKEEPDGDKEDPEKASREMLKNTKKRKKPKISKDYDHLMKMRDNQKDLDKAKETTGDKSWETRHCGVEEGQGRPRRKAKVKFLLRMKKMMRDQETTGVDGQVRQRRKAKVDNHRKRKKMGDKENGEDKKTTSNEPRNCGLCCSIGRTRVMICCDYCHEWYHRDCIGIGRDAYRRITKYACPPCASLLKMKPEDQIVYEEEEAVKDSAEDEEEEEELDQVLIQDV